MKSSGLLKRRRTIVALSFSILVPFLGASESAYSELLFFDNFDYVVDRNNSSDPSGVNNPFVQIGGWERVKAVNITGSSIGYLHTVTGIPGYTGPMPVSGSERVLKIESRNVSGGSDFYLQYGDVASASSDNRVPADVWFQFWHFTNHSSEEPSRVESRHKWIYPCNNPYPCHTNKWLLSLSAVAYSPYNISPFGNPTANGEAFLVNRDNMVGTINYSAVGSDLSSKLGQTNIDEYLVPNRWQLVKIHFDTSDSRSGKFEAWIKPLGGQFTKVAEWIGGVTPEFSWTFPVAGGHRGFRIPTTIGWTDGAGAVWYYIDDFAMASTEDSLPRYDGRGVAPPSPPNEVTIVPTGNN